MNQGRVYQWRPEAGHPLGGAVRENVAPLRHLEDGDRLVGRFVRVRNGGAMLEPDEGSGGAGMVRLGDARADAAGDFLFAPSKGGERVDGTAPTGEPARRSYLEAARFGEVNTYYHLDRIAAYVDGLLRELGEAPLPVVTAVVNAHSVPSGAGGSGQGVRRRDGWRPFQGGHYRLPSWRFDPPEPESIEPTGEIHLGPGWRQMEFGALAQAAGGAYRHNASHNAGTLYHEYGHHIHRHTADFRANAWRAPECQSNRKIATDEGTCDYWAATMLETPHIWAWHHRHDGVVTHRRRLVARKTMADYDPSPEADPHINGTIWPPRSPRARGKPTGWYCGACC